MRNKFSLIIVIPCFNESDRIQKERIYAFLRKNISVGIVFVNDGSTDSTIKVIEDVQSGMDNQIFVISNQTNLGKAESVRIGFLFTKANFQLDKLAYLDADLSTSLDECYELSHLINPQISFVFGSRISKIDNLIDRRFYRFIIGRFIATLISAQLNLTVYDSQCGCKIFRSDIIGDLFHEPFLSKWLFDVEIFHRLIKSIGRDRIKFEVKEVPLESWIDTKDSRVEASYFIQLWRDLHKISKKYNKKEKVQWQSILRNAY